MRSKYGFVIRAYNVESFLARAVRSVMAQTFTGWKAVIVDDGSQDDTYSIAKSFEDQDERIQVLKMARGGVLLATLEGVQNLDCEYISFLDGDDWLDARYLEEADKVIRQFGVDIVANGMTRHFDDGTADVVRLKEEITILDNSDFLAHVFESTAFGLSIKIIKKELYRFDYEELSFFKQERTNLNFNEDSYQIVPIICNAGKCAVLDSCLYQYYIRTNSISREIDPWPQVRYIFMTMQYMQRALEKRGMLDDDRKRYILAEFIRELLPRARYIVKRFYNRLDGRFHLAAMGYYAMFERSDCFKIARERYGLKNALALFAFLIMYQ